MEQLLQFAWTILLPVLGFVLKWMVARVQKDLDEHKSAHKELEKELNQVKLNYVHTTEMEKIRTEIMNKFDKWETIILELARK